LLFCSCNRYCLRFSNLIIIFNLTVFHGNHKSKITISIAKIPGKSAVCKLPDLGKNSQDAQWKIIRITSMEVDFWVVKSRGCENSHATEVKCSNILQKSWISYRKRSETNVKAAENPKFSGFHSSFPSRNDFLIKILLQYRWKVQNFRGFDVYFAYFSVWNFIRQICGLIRQAKSLKLKLKKSPFFRLCSLSDNMRPLWFWENWACVTIKNLKIKSKSFTLNH
jgi:hypothetical protein